MQKCIEEYIHYGTLELFQTNRIFTLFFTTKNSSIEPVILSSDKGIDYLFSLFILIYRNGTQDKQNEIEKLNNSFRLPLGVGQENCVEVSPEPLGI